MVYRTDYHTHSAFSDGRAKPEDYIAPAKELGLREIGFSDHLLLFGELENWHMRPETISTYLQYIQTLKDQVSDIIIRTGLEVDFLKGREEEIRSFLKPLDLDYVIGSVHYLGNDSVDEGPEFYQEKSIDRLFESYFDSVIAAVESGIFDIIGHCDLIRIYGHRPTENPEHLYRKLAKAMSKNDIVFEVNTNGRNRPLADFYPDRRFLHIFREENVAVCVNSDAHMPSRLGQYFDEAYELLRLVGYNEMAVFQKRRRRMVPF
jgi:histidinol-phosphatase (PHP family)